MPRTRRQLSQHDAAPDISTSSLTKATRSSRRSRSVVEKETDSRVKKEEHDSENEDDDDPKLFVLDGEEFTSYQSFVEAKRKRNQAVLTKLGFGSGESGNKRLKIGSNPSTSATQRGLRSNKKKTPKPMVRSRKSSRISGDRTKLVALDMYVND